MASMDAISMLKDDHKVVEHLFKRFEKAGSRAHVEKRDIVDRIIEALSMHAAIEEQLFYPVVRATVPDTEGIALESLEEHHIVKWVLSELDSMTPEDERFDAKVTVLIENVRHHVKEEEQEFFPMVRAQLGRNALSDLGEAMAAAKKVAPTQPHPRSPDTPPGNLVLGTTAGIADRIGDMANGLAQGSVTAVGDIIATVLRRNKPRVSPTGSKLSRTTATQVRAGTSDATEAAIEAVRTAKHAGERVLHTAKATRSSAGAGAKRNAEVAKRGAPGTALAAKAGVQGTATSTRTSTARAAATAKRGMTNTTRTARAATKSTATSAERRRGPDHVSRPFPLRASVWRPKRLRIAVRPGSRWRAIGRANRAVTPSWSSSVTKLESARGAPSIDRRVRRRTPQRVTTKWGST